MSFIVHNEIIIRVVGVNKISFTYNVSAQVTYGPSSLVPSHDHHHLLLLPPRYFFVFYFCLLLLSRDKRVFTLSDNMVRHTEEQYIIFNNVVSNPIK